MPKVLIVDDSAFMRKILSNIISKETNLDIIEAIDGEEAITAYKSKKPEIVLLDIIMENKDGIEALKEIIKIDKKAKVIMVSAVGQEQMVREALKCGARDFIVKPFDSKKVADTIKKMMA